MSKFSNSIFTEMVNSLVEIKTLLVQRVSQREAELHPIDLEIERVMATIEEKKDEELNQQYGFDRQTFQDRFNPLEEQPTNSFQRFFRTVQAGKNVLLVPVDRVDLVIKDLLYLFPPSNFQDAIEYAVMCKANIDFSPDLEDKNRTIEMYNVIFNDHRYDFLRSE